MNEWCFLFSFKACAGLEGGILKTQLHSMVFFRHSTSGHSEGNENVNTLQQMY